MRKTRFATATAAVFILAGFAGWAISSNRSLQAKTSAAIESRIDSLSVMLRLKDLPTDEFEDLSVVFSAPVAEGRSSPTPAAE